MKNTFPAGQRAWADISLDAIRHNIQAIQASIGNSRSVMAVVKADAYGHGLIPCARAATEAGALWLGVATIDEAAALRQAGFSHHIALICPQIPLAAASILSLGLTPLTGDPALINALAEEGNSDAKSRCIGTIHLEIDTGIGRSGILWTDAVSLWQHAVAAGLRVAGLTTHFAEAKNDGMRKIQWQRFQAAKNALHSAGAMFDYIHLDNSEAILGLPSESGNLVRTGLLMYGITPSLSLSQTLPLKLRPALTLKALVATVRALPEGAPISYGMTHHLQRDSRVATLLIGYGDGFPRRLSNCGTVLLRGQQAPILGRVCMDQTVVDVTDIDGVVAGEEAVCIGAQGDNHLSIEKIAALLDTTEHEITTCLTCRLPRRYLEI